MYLPVLQGCHADLSFQSIDSKSLFQIFSKLARRHPTVHFLRLSSQYAEELPSTSLPAILAYRRGELIANLVHFVDELLPGEKIDDTAVQDALVRFIPIFPPANY